MNIGQQQPPTTTNIVLGPLPHSTYHSHTQGQSGRGGAHNHHHQHHHQFHQQQQQQTGPQPAHFHIHQQAPPPPPTTTNATTVAVPNQPQQTNDKGVSRGRANKKMSTYDTNPVGALQERFQSRGMIPNYHVVQTEGASHAPTFSFQVSLADLTATGTGSSKKQAKHAAARAMLDKLDGRMPSQDGQAPLPPVAPTNGAVPQPPGNTVGALQELCVKQGYNMPTYSTGQVGGQPHQRNFTMICTVGKYYESGTAGSKKDAKREAAQKMIDKLKALGPNAAGAGGNGDAARGDAPSCDLAAVDYDDIIKRINNIKLDKLTPEVQEKVNTFYTNLKKNNGVGIAKLLTTPLKPKSCDSHSLLNEIGKEKKIDIIYQEIPEKTEDGKVQCLVQLTKDPVAVYIGVGKDSNEARQEAARTALNHLKIMTKPTFHKKK